VPLLLLKLTLTPLLVGGASIASRRWGPAIGGWIVSLPLTSGPVLFFMALDQGPAFAAEATTGTLLGLGAIAGFCAAYLAASRQGPAVAITAASLGYLAVGIAVQPITGAPFALLVVLVAASITAVLRILPAQTGPVPARPHAAWDLPARIVIGTVLVVGFTALAPLLGPVTSGLVATFPVYVSVLAVFEHMRTGRTGALSVLRGLLTGLYGTVAFYVVLRVLLVPAGIAIAFGAAILVTAAVGAVALRTVRAGIEEAEPEPI
jgi:hypothetical protein